MWLGGDAVHFDKLVGSSIVINYTKSKRKAFFFGCNDRQFSHGVSLSFRIYFFNVDSDSYVEINNHKNNLGCSYIYIS